MSKEKTKEANEEIIDAKATAIAPVETAVSAEVQVQGVQLDFPFLRIGQGMSQWKTPQTKNGKPELGSWYIGKNKDNNFKIADGGKDSGIFGIILQKVDGFKEDRPYSPGNNSAPRRWTIGAAMPDGSIASETDCLEAASKEGFSLVPKATGEVWPDSGRPKMRANLAKFCYLMMLVPVPDDFESDEFRVYPIGDHLYTTARFEFDKQYFKQMDDIVSNIRSRAMWANRANKDYQFTLNGLVCHIYSFDAESRSGVSYISHGFEKAVRDGKPWEFTKEELDDFTRFLMSAKAGTATVEDIDAGEF